MIEWKSGNTKNNESKFFDLEIWKEAHNLTLKIYEITERFPKKETHGLVSQLRRAALSIPSNIAEGSGKRTTKEFIRFLFDARGSANEILYQLILAKDLNYITEKEFRELVTRYEGLIKAFNKLISKLKKRIKK